MRIITDSTCDLDFKFLEENDVDVVCLKYFFGQEEFVDGITISSQEFYQKLRTAEELPTTSQPNPEQFAEVFEKYAGEEILVITLSSELSGTMQSANIAKGMVENEKIEIVDSRQVTFSLAATVLRAIELKKQGKTIAEIKADLEKFTEKTAFFAVVTTLKYLTLGGRLSKTAGAVGSLLNMKPILSIEDGKIVSFAKARGEQNAYAKVLEKIQTEPIDYNFPIVIAHGDASENLANFKKYLSENGVNLSNVVEANIGTVVGVHAGPGAVGLSYQKK